MAWQDPVTTWSNGNRFTYNDMNRIAGNVNFLYPSANLKDDYTQNDFLTTTQWSALTSALQDLIVTTGLSAEIPGEAMTADTINDIESLTQDLYDRIGLNNAQVVANIYTGDDLYAAATGQYTDVAENYTRGV